MVKEKMTPGKRWDQNPYLMDRDWLIAQFRSGKTLSKVAVELGISDKGVRKAVKYHGIKRPYGIVHDARLEGELSRYSNR